MEQVAGMSHDVMLYDDTITVSWQVTHERNKRIPVAYNPCTAFANSVEQKQRTNDGGGSSFEKSVALFFAWQFICMR